MQPDPTWTAGKPVTEGGPCIAPDEGLHEAVARTALFRPDAVAVVAGDRPTTYGELDSTADAWAARLVDAGVGRGDLVPILLPRGSALVTALLAVLKAGAAYALLDPAWPAHRVQEVVDELGARLLATGADTPGPPGLPVWSPPAGPVEAPRAFRPARVAGTDPCCVFFTSGTTGRPKGVVSPHAATARLFQCNGFARFDHHSVVPLAAAVPWDAFSLELWSVLLNGGTSVVVDEPYLSATALRRGIARHGVDTIWLTSSLFTMLVDEDLDAFTGLEQVMTGGERLSPAHVGAFLHRHPAVRLINGYGPVESTVFATTHPVTGADAQRPGGIPLGRPVPGTVVQVLDGERPCGIGETGEICIAGAGLAPGYLGDALLTAAKFVRIAPDGTARTYYRTGDLGCWDADGLLHFGGRADRQVKIRGHRVEPAEVERQVERLLPAVRDCRVLARAADGGAASELVAFCVPAEPGDALEHAPGVLRSALVAHHRPAAVVSVAAFPVTARGKLDERALLALADDRRRAAPAATAARDATTRAVAEVFGEVLGTAAVPSGVSFFELGGSSLGAGRVCARLAARLARPVPVSRLYDRPTVDGLAGLLRAPVPEAAPPHATGEVPLTPMQLVYLTRHLVAPADRTGHCLLVWSIEGDLDRAALQVAVDEVHLRHEPLSACYLADPRPAVWLDDVPPPEIATLPARPGAGEAVRALRDALAEELDPAKGLIWRVATVPAGDVTLFGCAVHHIAFDGWSESVLARDIAAAYNAARGRPGSGSPLPPPLEQVARARPPADEDRLRCLAAEMAGVPDLRWPDGPTGPGPTGPGRVERVLPPEVMAGVDAAAAGAGVTRFVVLLARWAATLAATTGQRDFAVGVPVAQRDHADLEHAVGCHITMLCLRMRGEALGDGTLGDSTLGDSTDAYRATGRIAGRAFACQDVPFPEVLRLAGPAGGSRPPLFQTLFALQDNAEPRLDLEGARTTFLRQPYLDIPLELHAELWPRPDGGLRLEVAFRRDAVPDAVARELADRFCAAPSSGRGVS